jgi:IS30 family transposase
MQTSPWRYQQLQPEDRVTMASLLQKNHSLRDIAAVLKRSPSTISREHHRNVVSVVGTVGASPYASATAQRSCQQRRRAGRPFAKLHTDRPMFEVVRRLLGMRWSPEQIALTLAALYPKGHGYRVSTETIYNCIYAQPVGELKREQAGHVDQTASPQACQCSQRAPGVYGQATGHCSAHAPEHDVRPGQRDGQAQGVGQSNGHRGVLL